jgi:uncharacterized membrane protein
MAANQCQLRHVNAESAERWHIRPGYNARLILVRRAVSNLVFRFAVVRGPAIHWFLGRNCSLRPAQFGWLYLSLCVVSLGIAVFFWWQGAVLVLPFTWVELAAVGAAFLAYARHAADREHILLQGGRLVVELESAGRLERAEFNRDWVRVEPAADGRSLIEVSGQGQCVNIGRFVRPELRTALARELRQALREA